MLNIQAIFDSIDGEVNGFNGAGELCTFIRLRGCNLRCEFCDTKYAQDQKAKELKSVEDILKLNILPKVTITGGEPLIQEETTQLVLGLLDRKHRVSIETNGSLSVSHDLFNHMLAKENLRLIVDYKLPSSKMEDQMRAMTFFQLRDCDVIKFVIDGINDFYIARGLVLANRDTWKARKVFSPAIKYPDIFTGWPKALAEMMIDEAHMIPDVSYSLQIHKVLWPGATHER